MNSTTKNDPFPLPFTNEVFNTMVGSEAYSFLDEYSKYHHIFIIPKDRHKTFVCHKLRSVYLEGDAF